MTVFRPTWCEVGAPQSRRACGFDGIIHLISIPVRRRARLNVAVKYGVGVPRLLERGGVT